MMATTKGGGRLIMLTTPAGKRGAFFEGLPPRVQARLRLSG
jgi:hypothetical protein